MDRKRAVEEHHRPAAPVAWKAPAGTGAHKRFSPDFKANPKPLGVFSREGASWR
jgi:hypothetical protein